MYMHTPDKNTECLYTHITEACIHIYTHTHLRKTASVSNLMAIEGACAQSIHAYIHIHTKIHVSTYVHIHTIQKNVHNTYTCTHTPEKNADCLRY